MISNIAEIHEGTRYRIKDREKAGVYQEISNSPGSSRKCITARLKLRPTTVSKIVGELISDGLVEESEERLPGSSGRPQISLRPVMNRLSTVTIYVQAREIRAARINLAEDVLEEYAAALPADVTNDDFLGMCKVAFGAVTRELPSGSEVLGVAVSLVGTVNSAKKTWVSTARWRNIRDLDFLMLERQLGLPVILNRMQDAELRYFIQKNPACWKRNVLFVHWGFGIGASYAHAGSVIGSSIGRFCEIGHTRISPTAGKRCQCGAAGCLETEAALWAIQGRSRTIPEDISDERSIARVIRDADLLSDPVISGALDHFMTAVLNFHQVFYPDVIVFNGPFTENTDLFRRLELYLRSELPAYARDKVELVVIPGGFGGCVRGSVYPFFKGRLGDLLRTHSF